MPVTVALNLWYNPSIIKKERRILPMEQTKTYRAGLYCRLSKDDDQSGESTSVSTQRSMVKNAERQRARNSCLIASNAPYGYVKE